MKELDQKNSITACLNSEGIWARKDALYLLVFVFRHLDSSSLPEPMQRVLSHILQGFGMPTNIANLVAGLPVDTTWQDALTYCSNSNNDRVSHVINAHGNALSISQFNADDFKLFSSAFHYFKPTDPTFHDHYNKIIEVMAQNTEWKEYLLVEDNNFIGKYYRQESSPALKIKRH